MKKLYQTFFYIPKRSSVPTRVFQTRTLLSALTMLVCCAVFTSATLAYFTSSQSSGVSKIQSASYEVTVELTKENTPTSRTVERQNRLEKLEDEDVYLYTCPTGESGKHSFKLSATGTASKGYYVIGYMPSDSTEESPKEIVEALTPGAIKNIEIEAIEGSIILFAYYWGDPEVYKDYGISFFGEADSDVTIDEDGCIVFSRTPYVSYSMEENVSLTFYQLLEELEFYYSSSVYEFDVTVDDIWAFNGFDALAEELGIEINEETLASDVLAFEDEVKIPYVLENELDEEVEPFTAADPDESEELPPEILPLPDGSLPVDPDAPAVPADPDQAEQPTDGEGAVDGDDAADPDQPGEGDDDQPGEDGQTSETPSAPATEPDGGAGDGQQTDNGETAGTDDGQTDGEGPAASEPGATDNTDNTGDNDGSDADDTNDGASSETDSDSEPPKEESAPAESAEEPTA